MYTRTNATHQAILRRTGPLRCRSTAQDRPLKDSPHPQPLKVLHRGLHRLQHPAQTPETRTRTSPPTTTSPAHPASTLPTSQKEEVLLPRLKLAIPMARARAQHIPRLRNQHSQARHLTGRLLPMRRTAARSDSGGNGVENRQHPISQHSGQHARKRTG